MTTLKVGVFNDCNIPSHFAHSFNAMKMAQGFSNIGCNTRVITANSLLTLRRRLKYPDIQAHYGLNQPIKIHWKFPSLKKFISGYTQDDLVYASRVAKFAQREQLDLVFARSYEVSIAAIKQGLPTVMETHTTNYDHPSLNKIYAFANDPNFKGLVTIHNKIAEEHCKRGIPENKLLVLEDGVDLKQFDISDDKAHWQNELGLSNDYKYAVYCGHLYKEKGIQVILDAAAKLKQVPNLRFILAGGLDSDIRQWQEQCEQRNIMNIIFTGFLENQNVPKYLRAADCLLLPYSHDIEYHVMDVHTTSPLKLFEYLAAGRPIIATGNPTITKILTHQKDALLTKPGKVDDFCKSVQTVITNTKLQKTLSKNAKSIAHKYTWDGRCQQIIDELIG